MKFSKLDIQKQQSEQYFIKEDIKMSNKHTKKMLVSFITKKIKFHVCKILEKAKTLRTVNISVVARSLGSGKGLTTKGHRGIVWIGGTVLYLNCMRVTWLYAFVKIHRIYSKKGEFYYM